MKEREQIIPISVLIGFLPAVVGLIVAIGWFIHSEQLIRISNNFAPMQFNTALCFILAGLSLFFIHQNNLKISFYCGFALLLISGLTFCEYVFEINFHIDELFIKSYLSTSTQYPGRMAPNAALCFVIFALSIGIISLNAFIKFQRFHLFGMLIILSLGLLSICGYFTDFETSYGLGQSIKMALHTALGLIGLSLGLILYLYDKKCIDYSTLVPYLISFMLLNVTFLSWQTVKNNQEAHLNIVLDETINSLSSSIKTYMIERANAFERIAHRWLSQKSGTPKQVWENDVLHYIEDQPGYVAIEWVDKQCVIRWAEPKSTNQQIIGYNLCKDSHRKELYNKSLNENHLVLSPQLDLIQGSQGMLLMAPLKRNAYDDGVIVGVINSKQFFERFLKNFKLMGVLLTINNDNEVLYTTHLPSDEKELTNQWIKKEKIELYGQVWQITIQPNRLLYQEIISTTLPFLILVLGALISVMTGIVVQSLLSVKKLQYLATSANERLKGVIEGSSDYIAALDTNYNFLLFNKLYQSEIYRLFHVELQVGMSINTLFAKMSPENVEKTRVC